MDATMGWVAMKGYYLVRGSDGLWHAVVPGLEELEQKPTARRHFGPDNRRLFVNLPTGLSGAAETRRDPWWVRLMDFLAGGLDRSDGFRP